METTDLPDQALELALFGALTSAVAALTTAVPQVTASSASAPAANTDLPDEFFELTTEDYAAWARAMEARKKVGPVFSTSVVCALCLNC